MQATIRRERIGWECACGASSLGWQHQCCLSGVVFKLGSKRRGCHWAQSLAYRLGSTDPSMHMRLVEALAEHGRAAL
eukprot:1157358-Pelagomonas_calceolata.AAC.12